MFHRCWLPCFIVETASADTIDDTLFCRRGYGEITADDGAQ